MRQRTAWRRHGSEGVYPRRAVAAVFVVAALMALTPGAAGAVVAQDRAEPEPEEPQADISVGKSFPLHSPAASLGEAVTVTPGEEVTYRVQVANHGPDAAQEVVVTDLLPDGLDPLEWRVVSGSPDATCDLDALSCDLGTLDDEATVELELDVLVGPDIEIDADEGLDNTVTVTTTTNDPVGANDRSTFTVNGPVGADLMIRKFAPGPDRDLTPVDDPVAGTNTSYVLEVANFGPSGVTDVEITDTLPPGVTFVRDFAIEAPETDAGRCEADAEPGTVSCQVNVPFQAFDYMQFGVEVAIDPMVPAGTVLANQAVISSDLEDPNPANNSSTAPFEFAAEADLTIAKEVVELDANGEFVRLVPEDEGPLAVPPGHAVEFAVEVTNNGPSAAAGLQVNDTFALPGAVPLSLPEGCDPAPVVAAGTAEVVCAPEGGEPLPPGESWTTQVRYVVPGDAPPGEHVNTVTVTSSTPDPDPENDTDQRPVVIGDPVADLIVDKTALTTPLVAGSVFTYQIEVQAGQVDPATDPPTLRLSSDATDVVVSDVLPGGLVPTGATASSGACAVTGQQVSCEVGTVPGQHPSGGPGPVRVVIVGTVDEFLSDGEVTNTAQATSSTLLLDGLTEATASATTPVERHADIGVVVDGGSEVTPGGEVTLTPEVTNAGPSGATDVEVVTTLPPETVVVSVPDGCTESDGVVTCGVASLPPDSEVSFPIVVTVPDHVDPGSVLETTGETSSSTPDPDESNDTATAPAIVTESPPPEGPTPPQAVLPVTGAGTAKFLAVAGIFVATGLALVGTVQLRQRRPA